MRAEENESVHLSPGEFQSLRDIVLREAERGNAEAQAMLGSWHTMMPFC